MYISKSKNYIQVSLSELKEDLRIHEEDTSFDAELSRLIKSAVAHTEKNIQSDIVLTTSTIEDYNQGGSTYRINEPNVVITSITITNNLLTTPETTNISGNSYIIERHTQYTLIRFKNSYSAEKIVITYTSGYSVIPEDLKRAIYLYTGWLFDMDKNGSVSGNFRETKTYQRLITPYINMIEV